MKRSIILSLAIFALTSSASAQSRYNYDWQSGNSTYTTPTYNGGARVQGFNSRTGNNWNTNIDRRGNMQGFDSRGNSWNYNRSTKTYMNSNGKVCVNGFCN